MRKKHLDAGNKRLSAARRKFREVLSGPGIIHVEKDLAPPGEIFDRDGQLVDGVPRQCVQKDIPTL